MKRMFLILLSALLFSGCGGGGTSGSGGGGSGASDNSTSGYTGNTNQATLTAGNARAMSVNAVESIQNTSTVGVLGKIVGGTEKAPYAPLIAGIVEEKMAGSYAGAAAKTAAETQNGTEPGFTGSFSYSIDGNQTTGAASGSIAFNQYQASSGAETISGKVTFSGAVNTANGDVTSISISMPNLTISSSTQTFSISGNITLTHSATSSKLTMSVIQVNTSTHETYWMKDFTLTLAGNSMTMSGTYYDHTYGYVIITTVVPVTVSNYSDKPVSGRLLFTGSNGTKARLTFTSTGYTLEVDTNGSNTFVAVP